MHLNIQVFPNEYSSMDFNLQLKGISVFGLRNSASLISFLKLQLFVLFTGHTELYPLFQNNHLPQLF